MTTTSDTANTSVRCSATKADGSPCGAFPLRGQDVCAGHAGLGLASDPVGAGRRGAVRSAEVRSERAEARKRGVRQALADAVEREYLDAIIDAYGRALSDADPAVAVRAAEAILSRVYGKPKEIIEKVRKPQEFQRLEELSDEELWAVFRASHDAEESASADAADCL